MAKFGARASTFYVAEPFGVEGCKFLAQGIVTAAAEVEGPMSPRHHRPGDSGPEVVGGFLHPANVLDTTIAVERVA